MGQRGPGRPGRVARAADAADRGVRRAGHPGQLRRDQPAAAAGRRSPPTDWDATMAVNLTAPFLLGQRFGPAHGRARLGADHQHRPRQQATRAFGNSGGYGASKGGLAALTRSQSEAWAPPGVCCNAVCPGFVPTPLTPHVAARPGAVGGDGGPDDDRPQRVAGGLRRGRRVPGLPGQRLRDRPDHLRGRRVLRHAQKRGVGLFCRCGTAECSVWQDDEAVPPRPPRISKRTSSTSTSPRRCAAATSSTPTGHLPARAPRRPGRPEAGAAPDPVPDERDGPAARTARTSSAPGWSAR